MVLLDDLFEIRHILYLKWIEVGSLTRSQECLPLIVYMLYSILDSCIWSTEYDSKMSGEYLLSTPVFSLLNLAKIGEIGKPKW